MPPAVRGAAGGGGGNAPVGAGPGEGAPPYPVPYLPGVGTLGRPGLSGVLGSTRPSGEAGTQPAFSSSFSAARFSHRLSSVSVMFSSPPLFSGVSEVSLPFSMIEEYFPVFEDSSTREDEVTKVVESIGDGWKEVICNMN